MSVNVDLQNVSPATIFMSEMFSDLDMLDVPTGFQSFFGRAGTGGRVDFIADSLQYSMDTIRGLNTTSRMLTRETGGSWNLGTAVKSLKGEKFRNKTRLFPLMEEQMHIAFEDLFQRRPGENPISNVSDSAVLLRRLRGRFGDEIKAAILKLMFRYEVAAAESIITGIQSLDDGVSFYDFDRSSGNTFSAPTPWDNAAADIIAQIDSLITVGKRSGRKRFNFGIAGAAMFGAMVKKANFKEIADNRGYRFIRAGDKEILPNLPSDLQWMEQAGFTYQMYIQTYEGRRVPIFTYDEEYVNHSGVDTALMPTDQFLMGWAQARCDKAFGPRITFPNNPHHDGPMNSLLGFDFTEAPMPMNMKNPGVFDTRMFHIDGKINGDNDAIAARMVTGGIYNPVMTDCFGLIEDGIT